MGGVNPVRVSSRFSGKLLGVGSILDRAKGGDVVWGSGLIQGRRFDGRNVTFAAVRGPRTRRLISGDVPEVFGDPAVLLPKFYTPQNPARRYDVGVVPHYMDGDAMAVEDKNVLMIDVQRCTWQQTVDQLASCDVIVASSLHGIIVSEAYGIPAVWVQPTNRLVGGEFKFRDFYEGTGREGYLVRWDTQLGKVVDQALAPRGLQTGPLLGALSVAIKNLNKYQYRP